MLSAKSQSGGQKKRNQCLYHRLTSIYLAGVKVNPEFYLLAESLYQTPANVHSVFIFSLMTAKRSDNGEETACQEHTLRRTWLCWPFPTTCQKVSVPMEGSVAELNESRVPQFGYLDLSLYGGLLVGEPKGMTTEGK